MYWQTTIAESAGNASKLWSELSAVMGKKRSCILQDGLTAEHFMNAFEKKVTDVRASTLDSDTPEFNIFSGECLSNFVTLTEDDVKDLIKNSPNKSCGLDLAPTWLIKEFSETLSPFVTNLFNKSLDTVTFRSHSE